MVDAVGSLLKLQRTILTWDYYSLAAKAEEGGGPFDNLRRVPNTFTDIRVGLGLSRDGSCRRMMCTTDAEGPWSWQARYIFMIGMDRNIMSPPALPFHSYFRQATWVGLDHR
jgi:hypothetical protein